MSDQSHSRVPEVLDAWRMVAARREFEGRIPLAAMTRLRDSLLQPDGDVRYQLAFGTDALKLPFAELRIEAELPLECQRSLQRFLLPVRLVQRLGLIRDEADEAALPEEYEALLIDADGAGGRRVDPGVAGGAGIARRRSGGARFRADCGGNRPGQPVRGAGGIGKESLRSATMSR